MKIETATIRRLRDALLQSGRRPSAVLSPAYAALARAGLLTEQEQALLDRVDPVAETLFLVMAADGKIDAVEQDAVRGAIRGLTNSLLHDGTIDVMMENYEKALAAEGREARLQRVAARLADHPSEAEGAFALAAAVALADDEVTDDERKLVSQVAEWFGISAQRVKSMLNQLEEDRASSGS
jgi:tellurite resistance protein